MPFSPPPGTSSKWYSNSFPWDTFTPGGSTFLTDKERAPGSDPALGLHRTHPDSATPVPSSAGPLIADRSRSLRA